jgi:quercetin dioxygenase-like cupin family protein
VSVLPDHPSRRGQVFENPVTGERVVMLTDPDLNPGRHLAAHLFVRPGGRVAAPHSHPGSVERFLVLRGQVGVLLDGAERVLGPGEHAEVRPGVVHDWWNVGDDQAEVLVGMSPGDRFVEAVGTAFGLARDGKVNRRGVPRSLQLAVTGKAYRDAVVFASPPQWVQRLMLAVLPTVGRWMGRLPAYPEYLVSSEVVEPDPAALALLDPDGAMRFQSELHLARQAS